MNSILSRQTVIDSFDCLKYISTADTKWSYCCFHYTRNSGYANVSLYYAMRAMSVFFEFDNWPNCKVVKSGAQQ